MSNVETDASDTQAAEGAQEDASASAPFAPGTEPPATLAQPQANASGGILAVHPEATAGGGDTDSADVPALEDLQNQICPNCSVGVLYVTRYDPLALHEAGQDYQPGIGPASMPTGFESGGAYELKCASCEWSASYALNPGRYHGRARD